MKPLATSNFFVAKCHVTEKSEQHFYQKARIPKTGRSDLTPGGGVKIQSALSKKGDGRIRFFKEKTRGSRTALEPSNNFYFILSIFTKSIMTKSKSLTLKEHVYATKI